MVTVKRFLACVVLGLGLSASVACSSDDNANPVIEQIADQTRAVGQELKIAVIARDPDGDAVSYSYKTERKIDATLVPGAGNAIFSWTPIAADVGEHSIDFIADDGKGGKGKRTIVVTVRSAVGSATAPVFRQPLGTGTTFAVTDSPSVPECVQLAIEIDDSDTPNLDIGQEGQIIEGSNVQQTGGHEGVWEWCPTQEQKSAKDIYQLVLYADDGENPRVKKDFLIILQKPTKPDCPGDAPVVNHTPADHDAVIDLTLDALVSDDQGLKFPPQVQYSTSDPGPNPDVSKLTQVAMLQIDGDLKSGTWAADIPNPVASQPVGASTALYYRIVATDNDDAEGSCDHVTNSPEPGFHKITVSNPGGAGGLGLCKSCTKDIQCGGASDTCFVVGTKSYCGKSCGSASGCPANNDCSEVTSVDGVKSKQCVPKSQSCTGGSGGTCTDDKYEENDSRSAVATTTPLPAGTYSLQSCSDPFWDDDYFPIEITSPTKIKVTLASSASGSNLDVLLFDKDGKQVAASEGTTSNESFEVCLTDPGRYYIAVWEQLQANAAYTLTWSKLGSCSVCVEDSLEENDSISQAKTASIAAGAYKGSSLQICSWDDDYFKVFLLKDETVHATLKFTQTKSSEDLDLYLYDSTGKVLVGCDEFDLFSCDPSNGQSSTSNENLNFKVPASGQYYVIVHGWEGAENKFDLCVDYTSTSKPTNGCPPL
jgi:hypothetical protein